MHKILVQIHTPKKILKVGEIVDLSSILKSKEIKLFEKDKFIKNFDQKKTNKKR